MGRWTGWVAALGGLLSLIYLWVPQGWLLWLGSLMAIVFGIWAVYE